MRLTEWWHGFFQAEQNGHIKSRTFRQSERDANNDEFLEQFEVLRSSKSLMKRALLKTGSRDCKSYLFAALCRALGIPTRLVVSLQSVPWQASVGKGKEKKVDVKGKGKARATSIDDVEEDDDDMEEVEVPEDIGTSSPAISVSSTFEYSPVPGSSKKSTPLKRHVIKTKRRKNNFSSECSLRLIAS